MRFQDKVVNVTVAVSGIGKEVVRKLANAQVKVVLVERKTQSKPFKLSLV